MVAGFTVNALQSALQGLNVAQQLIDVTSQNVSGASTPGYTTKTLAPSDLVAGGQVVGVTTGAIQRTVDENLQKTVWQETSTSNSQSTISTALGTIQSLYGTADAGTNFSTYLTNLQSDFTQLSASPSNSTLQKQVVIDAQTFAGSLNSAGTAITTQRNTAEAGIASSVTTINTQLQTIATLNTQIASAINTGTGAADLEDQRDQAISSLSQQIGISTYTSANGVVVVQTAGGQPLADTQARSLVFKPQPVGADSSYPANLGGVYIDSSTKGYDLASNAGAIGGVLGASLQLRDQVLPQQQSQLDELAEQTANRFSAQGLTLFTGPAGTIPANTPTSYVGLASSLTVNAAVLAAPALVQQGTGGTPIDAGDNSVIQNVLSYTFGLNANAAGTANVPFNTTGLGATGSLSIASQLPSASTLTNFAQQIMSVQANQSSQISAQSSTSGSYLATLQTSFSNSSAVNLDTQIANLTVYQNAYSCAAQVITTEQTLMTDLLNAVQG